MADLKPTGTANERRSRMGSDDRSNAPANAAVHPEDIDNGTGASSKSGVDLRHFALEQIQTFIAERFPGREISRLVAEVLRAEGFFTEESPLGLDGGVDIFAGRGPLGLDRPHLVVQVESDPSPVDVQIVRELHGILSTHGAKQALLVAWSGITDAALQELRNQFFQIRVWDSDDLLKAVLRNYDKLSKDLRTDLPLKRIWFLDS